MMRCVQSTWPLTPVVDRVMDAGSCAGVSAMPHAKPGEVERSETIIKTEMEEVACDRQKIADRN